MRRLLGLALCVALFAGCGGDDFNTTAPRATAARTKMTTPPPVTASERAAYLDAAERGVLDDPRKPDGLTDTQGRCIAGALVDGIGVRRLEAAGISTEELRQPGYDFPSRFAPSIPRAVKEDFGARLQGCGLGALFGSAIAASFGGSKNPPNPVEVECITTAFGSPEYRELLANSTLEAKPSLSTSLALARLLLNCLSFGRLVANEASSQNIALSGDEVACIDQAARASTALRRFLADKIAGRTVDNGRAAREFGFALASCLTPSHLRQLAGLPAPIISL